jgi:hypothetical protein
MVSAIAASASAMLLVKSRTIWSSMSCGSSAWSMRALMLARRSCEIRPKMECFAMVVPFVVVVVSS